MNEDTPAVHPDPSQQAAEAVTAEVSIDIESDVDSVWHALTTGDGLAAWMGEQSSVVATPGGPLEFGDVVTGVRRRGIVDRCEPGHAFEFTWWPDEERSEATRVAITLEPGAGATRVTVRETRPSRSISATGIVRPRAAAVGSTALHVGCWTWRLALLAVAVPVLHMAV